MIQGIAFLTFFVIWGLAPPVWWYRRRLHGKQSTLFDVIFGLLVVAAIEALLLLNLLFMHAITHGGILRWSFWLT